MPNVGRAVFASSVGQDNSVMVTAQHCGTSRSWQTPIGGAAMGQSNGGLGHMDIMLITGQSYSGHVYSGAHNTDTSALVHGTQTAVVDNVACPSGGYSGLDCRTRITEVLPISTVNASI